MPYLYSDKYLLRDITVEDVTDRYLSWFSEADVIKNIVFSSKAPSLYDLKNYIISKSARKDTLFFAIIDKQSQRHVGNIKYEPINEKDGYAIVGILIGEKSFRGIGLFGEVFKVSSNWLANNRNVKTIYLGVDRENTHAIRAYKKIGFFESTSLQIEEPSANSIYMQFELPDRVCEDK